MNVRGRGIPVWVLMVAAGFLGYNYLTTGPLPPMPPMPPVPPPMAGPQPPMPPMPPMPHARGGPGPRPAAYALRAENSWPPLLKGAPDQPQSPNLTAANYYVILDGSGSMNERACSAGQTKIEAARKALAAFAQSVPVEANLGLAAFENRGLMELLPLGQGNRDRFAKAVNQVTAGGGTPLSTAVGLAYERLLAQARTQLGYGEYHLVVVTDGLASDGYDPTPTVNEILASSPVMLHTIGFCIGPEHSLNQPGRTFYQAADNPEALRKGLDAVLAEAPTFDVQSFRDRLGP